MGWQRAKRCFRRRRKKSVYVGNARLPEHAPRTPLVPPRAKPPRPGLNPVALSQPPFGLENPFSKRNRVMSRTPAVRIRRRRQPVLVCSCTHAAGCALASALRPGACTLAAAPVACISGLGLPEPGAPTPGSPKPPAPGFILARMPLCTYPSKWTSTRRTSWQEGVGLPLQRSCEEVRMCSHEAILRR